MDSCRYIVILCNSYFGCHGYIPSWSSSVHLQYSQVLCHEQNSRKFCICIDWGLLSAHHRNSWSPPIKKVLHKVAFLINVSIWLLDYRLCGYRSSCPIVLVSCLKVQVEVDQHTYWQSMCPCIHILFELSDFFLQWFVWSFRQSHLQTSWLLILRETPDLLLWCHEPWDKHQDCQHPTEFGQKHLDCELALVKSHLESIDWLLGSVQRHSAKEESKYSFSSQLSEVQWEDHTFQ